MASEALCPLVAQCPAVAQLAETPLGARWYIVVPAYLAAFYPWTFLPLLLQIYEAFSTSLLDANSSLSQSFGAGAYLVRKQRTTLPMVIYFFLPLCFVIWYIVLQAQAEDYAEMSAAIVACLLGSIQLQHLLSSTYAIWEYKYWVTVALQCLALYGYLEDQHNIQKSPQPISSELSQNIDEKSDGMVLDRELFASFFFIIPLDRKASKHPDLYITRYRRFLPHGMKSLPQYIVDLLFPGQFRSFYLSTRYVSYWHARAPLDAEKLSIYYMVWFLSQYGSKWLADDESSVQRDQSRSQAWAKKVSNTSWARTALGYTDADNETAKERKRHTFLKSVLESGSGLPCCVNNMKAKRKINGEEVYGYSKFKSYISAAIESAPPWVFDTSPVEIQNRAMEISEVELEWFAIFVSHALSQKFDVLDQAEETATV